MDRDAAVELLANLHAAQNAFYGGSDSSQLRSLLADDVTWTVPGKNAISGVYRGVDAVFGYFARRRDIADKTFRMQQRDLLVGEGYDVAALTDGTATIHGKKRAWTTVGLYGVQHGRIATCWLLPLDHEQFDEIWGGHHT